MLVFPNIKINLGLNVIAKREDGYHALESVFYPVGWCDALEAVVSEKQEFKFSSSGIPVPGSESSNLIIKAFNLLKQDFNLTPLEIHLHKMIPMGAGLGGGSSDAAFMLKLINEICALKLTDPELERYAGQLGSDCPFFIRNKPSFVSGRGEILEPFNIVLTGWHILLVMPEVHVGTAEAYSWIRPHTPSISIKEILQSPVQEWKNRLRNDFEHPVVTRYPVIGALRDRMYETGATYAAMSGSGAAVFGLFQTAPDLTHFDGYTKFHTKL
jgi:4-diphosphocytidyl-2-C-methyl-D-erythritol kinase